MAAAETKKIEKYTKYERARLVGARALQISMGAPFMVELDEKALEKISYNPIEIAKLEFEKGVIPIEIKRPAQTGKK
jgi:DNA-directed RNA polymerase subunit K